MAKAKKAAAPRKKPVTQEIKKAMDQGVSIRERVHDFLNTLSPQQMGELAQHIRQTELSLPEKSMMNDMVVNVLRDKDMGAKVQERPEVETTISERIKNIQATIDIMGETSIISIKKLLEEVECKLGVHHIPSNQEPTRGEGNAGPSLGSQLDDLHFKIRYISWFMDEILSRLNKINHGL